MSQLPLRAQLATALGGMAATVSRLSGRGDGSVIGGKVALKLEPELLSLLARDRRLALITGTNGKTTTTRLVASGLAELGPVATNAFGANMPTGHVTALRNAPDATTGVLEVDEKYIPMVLRATGASVVVMMNLSRDQMDRASEIWMLAQRWREALSGVDTHVIANADDPVVAWGASAAKQVTWVSAGQHWREDSWCCPECGAHLNRGDVDWSCPECGLRRPETPWKLDDTVPGGAVIDPQGLSHELRLQLPGWANQSNAAIALAAVATFGVEPDRALPHMREVTSVAGRYTTVERDGRSLRLLLSKNPAGWMECFGVLREPTVPVTLSVNAQGPDGRDTSWLWDVDYRVLQGRTVFVTGERRLDLAVRLEADDVEFRLVDDIADAVAATPPGPMDVIANYTAFQQIRTAFGRVQ